MPFAATATPSNVTAAVTYDWDFGDGSPHSPDHHPAHAYVSPGTYRWVMVASVQAASSSATATSSGEILIGSPVRLSTTSSAGQITISWPLTTADSILEQTSGLGPQAL